MFALCWPYVGPPSVCRYRRAVIYNKISMSAVCRSIVVLPISACRHRPDIDIFAEVRYWCWHIGPMTKSWRLSADILPLTTLCWTVTVFLLADIYCDSFVGPILICLQRTNNNINILVRWPNPDVFSASGLPLIPRHWSNCENIVMDQYLSSCIGPMIKNRRLYDANGPPMVQYRLSPYTSKMWI